jgi:fermentation-respiration switch protein FrsA (DUF1100 family)
MKKISYFLFLLLLATGAAAQEFTGDWGGMLSAGGTQLKIVFHISKTGDTYSSVMDSPDQGVKGIPVTTTLVAGTQLILRIDRAGIEYTGTMAPDQTIAGVFRQAGQDFTLNLTRDAAATTDKSRPQEPDMPYPYYTEEVVFTNPKAGGIELAGTLSLPKQKGKFPVVILISGSGPQNRNEALLGHQPFLVLADHLTRNGIGVLRFDDRGTAASQGDFSSATTLDFATDVEAALAYLQTRKEVDKKQIGLIGHSEGGMIAPIVASRNKTIAFIVLLAGTGIPGDELLLLQQELIGRANGISEDELREAKRINGALYELVKTQQDPELLNSKLTAYLSEELAKVPDSIREPGMMEQAMAQLSSPWMLTFLRLDPTVALQQVDCPVLAMNGSKDLQVPADVNLAAIESALKTGGNPDVTIVRLDGLNHLFQECSTGSPKEYGEIEQTFAPRALTTVSEWIVQQTKK